MGTKVYANEKFKSHSHSHKKFYTYTHDERRIDQQFYNSKSYPAHLKDECFQLSQTISTLGKHARYLKSLKNNMRSCTKTCNSAHNNFFKTISENIRNNHDVISQFVQKLTTIWQDYSIMKDQQSTLKQMKSLVNIFGYENDFNKSVFVKNKKSLMPRKFSTDKKIKQKQKQHASSSNCPSEKYWIKNKSSKKEDHSKLKKTLKKRVDNIVHNCYELTKECANENLNEAGKTKLISNHNKKTNNGSNIEKYNISKMKGGDFKRIDPRYSEQETLSCSMLDNHLQGKTQTQASNLDNQMKISKWLIKSSSAPSGSTYQFNRRKYPNLGKVTDRNNYPAKHQKLKPFVENRLSQIEVGKKEVNILNNEYDSNDDISTSASSHTVSSKYLSLIRSYIGTHSVKKNLANLTTDLSSHVEDPYQKSANPHCNENASNDSYPHSQSNNKGGGDSIKTWQSTSKNSFPSETKCKKKKIGRYAKVNPDMMNYLKIGDKNEKYRKHDKKKNSSRKKRTSRGKHNNKVKTLKIKNDKIFNSKIGPTEMLNPYHSSDEERRPIFRCCFK